MKKYYAAICTDKAGPEAGQQRKALAREHLAYIETILDKIAVAGPLKRADGSDWGSILIYKVDSAEDARALLEGDPYAGAGIWDNVTIEAFMGAAGDWVGGKTW